MPVLTDYLENRIISHFFRNSAQTGPAAVYASLFTAAPNEDGTGGTEVSGGSYARQAITFGAPAAGATDNTAQITFPTATANWGTVLGVGIHDAASAGNLMVYSALGASQVVNSGSQFVIAVGNADLSFD